MADGNAARSLCPTPFFASLGAFVLVITPRPLCPEELNGLRGVKPLWRSSLYLLGRDETDVKKLLQVLARKPEATRERFKRISFHSVSVIFGNSY